MLEVPETSLVLAAIMRNWKESWQRYTRRKLLCFSRRAMWPMTRLCSHWHVSYLVSKKKVKHMMDNFDRKGDWTIHSTYFYFFTLIILKTVCYTYFLLLLLFPATHFLCLPKMLMSSNNSLIVYFNCNHCFICRLPDFL